MSLILTKKQRTYRRCQGFMLIHAIALWSVVIKALENLYPQTNLTKVRGLYMKTL